MERGSLTLSTHTHVFFGRVWVIPHICSLVNSHILPFPPHFKQWVHDHIFYSQEQVKYVLFTPCVLILTPFYMYSHHPDKLHRIHRVPFLPAIDLLKSPFSVQDLNSETEVLNAIWPCTAFHAHMKGLHARMLVCTLGLCRCCHRTHPLCWLR